MGVFDNMKDKAHETFSDRPDDTAGTDAGDQGTGPGSESEPGSGLGGLAEHGDIVGQQTDGSHQGGEAQPSDLGGAAESGQDAGLSAEGGGSVFGEGEAQS